MNGSGQRQAFGGPAIQILPTASSYPPPAIGEGDPSLLPAVFCWTKFGVEAGECIDSILDRKELERQASDGVFLWGIGNSIGPSLRVLLRETDLPEVLFTAMLSRARERDAFPPAVVAWHAATDMDGNEYRMPAASLVTSASGPGLPARHHYALVCQSRSPLSGQDGRLSFESSQVRNIRTGSPVGSSQVTSVVRRNSRLPASPGRYAVSFRAELVHPYLARLCEPGSVR